MSRLLNQLTLTISRDASEGYWLDGEWVAPTDNNFDIQCSIQPYELVSTERLILPAGISADAAEVVFTKSEVRTVDQFSQDEADTTTIDGLEYVAWKIKNFSRHSALKNAHYQITFVRKDIDKAGGI